MKGKQVKKISKKVGGEEVVFDAAAMNPQSSPAKTDVAAIPAPVPVVEAITETNDLQPARSPEGERRELEPRSPAGGAARRAEASRAPAGFRREKFGLPPKTPGDLGAPGRHFATGVGDRLVRLAVALAPLRRVVAARGFDLPHHRPLAQGRHLRAHLQGDEAGRDGSSGSLRAAGAECSASAPACARPLAAAHPTARARREARPVGSDASFT